MDDKREKSHDYINYSSVFISILALIAFIYVSKTNVSLMQNQQKWTEETRENQIKPNIQLISGTGFDDDKVKIVFKNIGNGIAENMYVCIGNSNKIMPRIFNAFYPFKMEGTRQNYIQPNQELKFSFQIQNIIDTNFDSLAKMEKIDLALNQYWTFYFSYFDIDGTEYLQTIKDFPAAGDFDLLFYGSTAAQGNSSEKFRTASGCATPF